jgi:porin
MKFSPLLLLLCTSVVYSEESATPSTTPKPPSFPTLFQDSDAPSQPPLFEELKEEPTTEQLYLLGNWNGERYKLRERGFDFEWTYVSDIQGNPVGGKHRGFAQAGSMGLNLIFDLQKLMYIPGLELFSSFVFRNGTNLSSRKIKNQFPVSQVFGGESYRLNELYFKEKLCKGNLNLKAGRLDAGNDFLQSPLNYYFVSNAFDGNPISVFFNSGFNAYPNATWGAYLDFKIKHQFKTQLGVYNINPNIYKNRYHGTNFTFHEKGGVLIIGQFDYLLNQAPKSTGLPGNYRIGYFYQTGKKAEFSGEQHKGNYSIYAMLDQSVYHNKDAWITPFANFIFAPQNRNLFPFFFDCGFTYDGIVKGRPDDALAFGAAYGSYSPDLRHVQREARRNKTLGPFGNQPQDFELVLELNYWWQVTKWFVVTPDIQYIVHPKGHPNVENALVIGVQIGVTL